MRPVTPQPSVSIVIPAAHAADSLLKALTSVAAQDYPNVVEVVVAAGDTASGEVAATSGAVVVDNSSGRTATAMNLAIAHSTGEIIVRVDAHSSIPPHYVSRVVDLIETTGADNVGGMQVPVGSTFWGKAVAAAMSSTAGAGDASYRIGGQPGPTDTVYLGAFRRSTLERLGGYDEGFVRHQDYELNERIRESGGTVWFDPELQVEYRPRSSLAALARQYFGYGTWKRWFLRKHPGSLRPRQWAPPVLIIGLGLSLVGSLLWPQFLLLPAFYAVALVLSGLLMLPHAGLPALGTPLVLAVMHISWGLGFLIGQTRDK